MANNTKLILLISVLTLVFSGVHLHAQQDTTTVVPVKKSNDKVLIGGKVYYIHLVKKGQTLYSISKTYNVSEKDITEENVDVLYGPLQVGQALKIPAYPKERHNEVAEDNENFILHLVEPNQTLYFLSRKYNVAVDTIVKYNPDAASGNLSIDQVVRIPRESVNTRERLRTESPQVKYLVYRVKAKETLYSLSRRFDISIDRIIEANPFLKNEGLKKGQELKIPAVGPDTNLSANAIPDTLDVLIDTSDVDPIDDDRMRVDFKCRGSSPERFRTYRVALLLPFQLDRKYELKEALDTISSGQLQTHPIAQQYRKFISENNYFYEFYEGAILALDSLKNLGFKVDFHVYDTEKSSFTVKRKIIPELEELKPDLIIGPVYKHNLRPISEFSLQHQIPFISPIFNDPMAVETNPYMFQVIPEGSMEIKEASDFISRFTNRNILLLHRGDSLYVKDIYDFRKNLYQSVNESNELDKIFINEIIYNDSIQPNLREYLKSDMPNLIVIPSPREIYVIPLLTKLNQLAKYYDIQVFGASQWQQFKNVDDDYFYNLRVHYYTPFYIDYSDSHVKSFIAKYRNWYNHEPVQTTPKGYNFSYLGYDVTFYFLNALRIYGTNFPGCLDYYSPNMLMSSYKFERNDMFSGFTNNAISIIRYNTDFTVGKLEIMKKIAPRWELGRND